MDFNNIASMNFSSYFECVIQEDSHIQQPFFMVTIPSLFPNVENALTPTKNTKPIDPNRSINKSNQLQNTNLVTTTIIKAANHTDYTFQLKGDSFKDEMDSTDGITEPEQVIEGKMSDFKTHKHEIKKPMTLNNYIYKNLNNVTVPKNSKAYGFFLNGTYDTTSFVIVRIQGAVPLNQDEAMKVQYNK